MNKAEVARIVGIVSMANGRRFDEPTMDFWAACLEDVPADRGMEAVVALAKRGDKFISPGDIRRRAVKDVLAPPHGEAWTTCHLVAGRQGYGVKEMHPAVQKAYWQCGGAGGVLRDGGTTAMAQFREIYKQIADEYDNEILEGDVRAAIEDAESRKARIEANRERLAIEQKAELDEIQTNMASPDHVRATIAHAREKLEETARKGFGK